MAVNGNILILKKNGQAIIALTGNELETASDTLEVASPSQGQWREHIAGRLTWKMTASWLMLSATTIATLLQPGQVFSMELVDREHVKRTLYGNAYLDVCKVQATRGNLVTGTFQLKGTAWLRPTYPEVDFNQDFNNDFLIE